MFLRIFQHLLPNARAWRLTIEKQLRQFFEGLTTLGSDIKTFIDLVWLDILPATTRELDAWEAQWGLPPNASLSEQERRDRLDAAWKALGGQSPEYIQETLQGAGFPVYVHQWWEPGTEPAPGVKVCVTPRNPLLVLREEFTGFTSMVECGEVEAACGEAFAECGNSLNPLGYPLVNKIFQTEKVYTVECGEPAMECGETEAQCGEFTDFIEVVRNYVVPSDPLTWPYFLYIGGETFPEIVTLSQSRKDEFEALCLKICPAQQWLGILAVYS